MSIIFNQSTILSELKWPPFSHEWNNKESIFRKRNEQEILLWLSTKYRNIDTFQKWLNSKSLNNELEEYSEFINWLCPPSCDLSIHELSFELTIQFILNCQEKILLWFSPEPHFPGGLREAIKACRRNYYNFLNNIEINEEDKSADSFLGQSGWGDFGWLIHKPIFGDLIHFYYEVLLFTESLDSSNLSKSKAYSLAKKSKRLLAFAIEQFCTIIKIEEQQELIIHDEEHWCSNILPFTQKNVGECISIY